MKFSCGLDHITFLLYFFKWLPISYRWKKKKVPPHSFQGPSWCILWCPFPVASWTSTTPSFVKVSKHCEHIPNSDFSYLLLLLIWIICNILYISALLFFLHEYITLSFEKTYLLSLSFLIYRLSDMSPRPYLSWHLTQCLVHKKYSIRSEWRKKVKSQDGREGWERNDRMLICLTWAPPTLFYSFNFGFLNKLKTFKNFLMHFFLLRMLSLLILPRKVLLILPVPTQMLHPLGVISDHPSPFPRHTWTHSLQCEHYFATELAHFSLQAMRSQ